MPCRGGGREKGSYCNSQLARLNCGLELPFLFFHFCRANQRNREAWPGIILNTNAKLGMLNAGTLRGRKLICGARSEP